MAKQAIKEAIQTAERFGCTVLGITQSKHYKIHLQAPDGRQATWITSGTPSDYRARANNTARIRRFATGRSNIIY